MAASRSRAWSVAAAASVGVVESLKDQLGICRWNHVIRSAQQHAKNHVRSFAQANNLSSSSSAMMVSSKFNDVKNHVRSFAHANNLSSSSSAMMVASRFNEGKAKQSEESLRTVMYLSCCGPN